MIFDSSWARGNGITEPAETVSVQQQLPAKGTLQDLFCVSTMKWTPNMEQGRGTDTRQVTFGACTNRSSAPFGGQEGSHPAEH